MRHILHLASLVCAAHALGRDWLPVGDPIDGEKNYDNEGEAIAVSGDGRRVILGSPTRNEANSNTVIGHGTVRVFEHDSTDPEPRWRQVGPNILPPDWEATSFRTRPRNFGQAVSLDETGRIALVGGGFGGSPTRAFYSYGYPKGNRGPPANWNGMRAANRVDDTGSRRSRAAPKPRRAAF